MSVSEIIQNVQFVTDNEGNKKAVQVDFRIWEGIIALIKEYEEDATEELSAFQGLSEAIDASRKRIKAGRFTRYEDIRRDV